MKKLMLIAAMIAAFGLGTAAAYAATSDKPPSPPGQPDCEHGNSQKPCKEDPQPDHGKECEAHGNQGGQNEDHCQNETTTTETTTTTTTTTETTTTTTETTPTTPTTTTPETTTTQTSSTETTPSQTSSTPSTTTPAETSAEPAEQEQQVFTPPVQQVESTEASQSGPASVAAPEVAESAAKPSKVAQPAPFTP